MHFFNALQDHKMDLMENRSMSFTPSLQLPLKKKAHKHSVRCGVMGVAPQTSHSMEPEMVQVQGLASPTRESMVSELEW